MSARGDFTLDPPTNTMRRTIDGVDARQTQAWERAAAAGMNARFALASAEQALDRLSIALAEIKQQQD